VRLEDGNELPKRVFDEIKKTAEHLTYSVAWKQDDILMVDNRRVLHGRKRCEGGKRSIYVRMGEPAFAA
jgi:alpha-ketoglutarate-dependent taurine dioxygenase